jgi:uracil phosphoribosyltransferase
MPAIQSSAIETPGVSVVDHALARTTLSILRSKTTSMEVFRTNVQELSMLLLIEAARNWNTAEFNVETPLRMTTGYLLRHPITFVPILRAGLGMLDGMLRVLPDANVGHLGIYRDEQKLLPVTYFSRFPSNLSESQVILIDPMLATGNSATHAVTVLKENGASHIQFICILSCSAGIKQLQSIHPEVEIVTAAIDPDLNKAGFIVPGLGDAGDRYFGTF